MDETLRERVRRRAYELWEADGRPEGQELPYWLAAEREVAGLSDAGEEDPGAGLDDLEPGVLKPSRGG